MPKDKTVGFGCDDSPMKSLTPARLTLSQFGCGFMRVRIPGPLIFQKDCDSDDVPGNLRFSTTKTGEPDEQGLSLGHQEA